jgi:uncharacterized protein
MRYLGLCLALVAAGGAFAQEAVPPHVIQVMGVGKVSTMPDIAVIDYWAKGEGKTPDDASTALVEKQKAIIGGVSALLHGGTQVTNSNLVIIAVRGPECQNGNSYNQQPRFDDGPCAVIGYLATIQGTIRTSRIDKAGTAVGLASRLGARDARLQSFDLGDRQAAYASAMESAIADAKRQAETIAKAAGAKLGPILMLRDQNFRPSNDVIVQGISTLAPPPPPPPAPRAPIEITVSPRPIDTSAQVYVSFAIAP